MTRRAAIGCNLGAEVLPGIAAAEPVGQVADRSRLLAITRGTLASEPGAAGASTPADDLRSVLEAILAKLDGPAMREKIR